MRGQRRSCVFAGLAEIQRRNRSRAGSCGNEPFGARPHGSFSLAQFASNLALRILHFESCSSNLGRVAERCSPMSMIAAQMHVALGGRENRCTAPRVVARGRAFRNRALPVSIVRLWSAVIAARSGLGRRHRRNRIKGVEAGWCLSRHKCGRPT